MFDVVDFKVSYSHGDLQPRFVISSQVQVMIFVVFTIPEKRGGVRTWDTSG